MYDLLPLYVTIWHGRNCRWQDLLKLERLKEELADQYGQEPTFAQWAAAAGLNQKTLRHRLNYGTLCKDRMIKSNIRLVISIAKNYQGAGMNLQDLVQVNCIFSWMWQGSDCTKGVSLSFYLFRKDVVVLSVVQKNLMLPKVSSFQHTHTGG